MPRSVPKTLIKRIGAPRTPLHNGVVREEGGYHVPLIWRATCVDDLPISWPPHLAWARIFGTLVKHGLRDLQAFLELLRKKKGHHRDICFTALRCIPSCVAVRILGRADASIYLGRCGRDARQPTNRN